VRSATFIAVAAFVALLIGGAVAVYAYDSSRDDRIAEGVRIAGVSIGGLDRDQARAKLRTELLEPLREPVVVRARGKTFRLTAREAKTVANLDSMVAEAVRRSREGGIFTRTYRGLTGGRVDAAVEPRVSFSSEAVGRLVSRVSRRTDRDARDADVQFAAAGLTRRESRDGLKVNRARLRSDVERALTQPYRDERIVTATVRRVKPKVTTDQLAEKYGTVVTVDRSGFTLRLFKDLKLAKTYPIAVGKAGVETPAGLYSIQNKAVNPTWNVPNSAWAGELAGRVIPPGPENPLKARWMGIYDGAGIHGTDARGSIGSNASHGCIRMLVEDVIELYDRVPVGAPVYIA
jgi:lipoprotein-anchoring transpeptidase ErfK/SrfK